MEGSFQKVKNKAEADKINRMLYKSMMPKGANKGSEGDWMLQEVIHHETGEVALFWPYSTTVTLKDETYARPLGLAFSLKKKELTDYMNFITSAIGWEVDIDDLVPDNVELFSFEDMVEEGWWEVEED